MLEFSYCESSDFFFTTQPLNSFSSVAFFLVALILVITIPLHHPRWRRLCPFAALCVLIGVGSSLWHVVQEPWALVADITPIFVFLFFFQYHFLKKFTDWSRARIFKDMVGLAALMGLASLVMNEVFLQKSNAFVPVVAWLAYIGVVIGQRFPKQARRCFMAAGFFALAIVARIIDMPLCEQWHYGTHFLWHMLSALTLYLVLSCFTPVVRRKT